MKFLKRKGLDDTTIRKVVDDERTTVFGVVGTVGDMLNVKLLEWCDYDRDHWCFLAKPGCGLADRFGRSREEATSHIEKE